jgi:hypothetical protein
MVCVAATPPVIPAFLPYRHGCTNNGRTIVITISHHDRCLIAHRFFDLLYD